MRRRDWRLDTPPLYPTSEQWVPLREPFNLTAATGFAIKWRDRLSGMNRVLRLLTTVLVVTALGSTFILLMSDMKTRPSFGIPAAAISAAPLLLIGASCLVFQAMLRPRWTELVKNMILAAAFLLWGVVQLMEQSALSKILGDVVIALYVLDLAWVILAGMYSTGIIRASSPTRDSSGG